MKGRKDAQPSRAPRGWRLIHNVPMRVAISAAGSLLASSAAALGLGEIDRQSALGEPLDVDIELTLGGGETLDSVQARLGDEQAYASAGLQRNEILEGLSLSVLQRGVRTFIHVSGAAHVGEPYLPLLVEVASGGSRMQHAYDLLLDPPQTTHIALGPRALTAETDAPGTDANAGPMMAAANHPPRHHKPLATRQDLAPVMAPEAPLPAPGPPLVPEDAPIPGLVRIRFSYALEGPVVNPAPLLRLSLRLGNPPAPGMPPQGAAAPLSIPATAEDQADSSAPRRRTLILFAALLAGIIAFRAWRARSIKATAPERPSAHGNTGSTGSTGAVSAMTAMLAVPLATAIPPPVRSGVVTHEDDWHAPASVASFALPERPVLEEPVFAGSDFFSNVAEFLLQTLQREPQRRDLRMKLLEVYFAAGAADKYLEQAQEYAKIIDLRDDPFWPEITRMGRELSPGQAFYEGRPPRQFLPEVTNAQPAAEETRNRRFYEGLEAARLDPALDKLSRMYGEAAIDPDFQKGFRRDLRELLRRPSDLQAAPRYSTRHGGALIYLKREDLHGAQDRELINAIGQIALAKYMGATRVVVGALHTGNHALAVARMAAKQGIRCEIFASQNTLATASVKLRALKELGAEVNLSWPAQGQTPDPRRAAMEAWLNDGDKTLFVSSLSTGPSPFPRIVLDLQTVVGQEVRRQLAAEKSRRRADAIVVNGEGGYETFGLLSPFLAAKATKLYSAVPVDAPLALAEDKVQKEGDVHRLSREHAWLKGTGRVTTRQTTYEAALRAVDELAQMDGISVAVEDGYALACAADVAASMSASRTIVALMGATRG